MLAAKKRVAAARRSAAAAKKKATPPSSGTGGGKPPEPPKVWLKSGGGDDEIRRKHFQDLATADRTVPIDHIVKGKVRRNRIHGAHDYERLEWIREKVSEGIEISHNGKTLSPICVERRKRLKSGWGMAIAELLAKCFLNPMKSI